MSISEFDYTCGAPLADPTKEVAIRRKITCAHPVEVFYYGGTLQTDASSTCCRCGGWEGEDDTELKKNIKTLLPLQ